MSDDLSSYMLKVAAGDKKSFRFIANKLGYKMHAIAIKLLGSAHFNEAEDVVQISLIKIWQSAPRWKKKGSLEGYVYQIVFSTCMDIHRNHKYFEEFNDNYFNPVAIKGQNINHESRRILLNKIQALPTHQQQSILLHYFCGYKQKEVSAILRKSEKAIESLIIRARKKLKTTLPKDLLEELFNV